MSWGDKPGNEANFIKARGGGGDKPGNEANLIKARNELGG